MQNETISSLFELFGIAIKRFIHGIPMIGLLLVVFFISSFISFAMLAKFNSFFKGEDLNSVPVLLGLAILTFVIIMFLAAFSWIAVACVASSKGDLKQDFNNLFMLLGTRGVKLSLALVAQFLILIVGYICFIIPGVYLTYRTLVLPQVVIYENKGFSEAFARSTQIMEGSKASTLITSLLLKIIFLIIGFVLVMVLASIFGVETVEATGALEGDQEELKGLGRIIYNLYNFSYEIVFLIFFNLIYLKRRSIGQTE